MHKMQEGTIPPTVALDALQVEGALIGDTTNEGGAATAEEFGGAREATVLQERAPDTPRGGIARIGEGVLQVANRVALVSELGMVVVAAGAYGLFGGDKKKGDDAESESEPEPVRERKLSATDPRPGDPGFSAHIPDPDNPSPVDPKVASEDGRYPRRG